MSASRDIELHKENSAVGNEKKSLPGVAVGDGRRVDKRLHTEETEPYIASIPTRILAHPLLL